MFAERTFTKCFSQSMKQLTKPWKHATSSFCTSKKIEEIINPEKLTQGMQRALWAQAFIDIIKRKPDSLEEVEQISLHERLLALEKPFPERFGNYQFDQKIKQEMRAFFLPGVGVVLPQVVFDQQRFRFAQNKNGRVTFYPTYSTTGYIFRHVYYCRTRLIYGRWGIGKSLSLVLCSMLANIVFDYFKRNIQEHHAYFKDILPIYQVLYWSISQEQTQLTLFLKIIRQRKYMWSDWGIDEQVLKYLPVFLKKLGQRRFELQNQLYSTSFGSSQVIIDQINMLASLKRQYNYLPDNQINAGLRGTLKKQINRLDYLKKFFEKKKSNILYSSSSNIEDDLIRFKIQDPGILLLGDRTVEIKRKQYDFTVDADAQKFQKRLQRLEFSQFFANIIEQYSLNNKNLQTIPVCGLELKQKKIKIKKMFQQYDWAIYPNVYAIFRGVQEIFERAAPSQKTLEILKSVDRFTFKYYYLQLYNFIQKKNSQFSYNVLFLHDKAFKVAIQKFFKREHQQENIKIKQNKDIKQISQGFEVKMTEFQNSIASDYNRQFFTYLGFGDNNHIYKCLASHEGYLQMYLIETLLTHPKQFFEKFKKNINTYFKQQKKSKYHSIVGKTFQYCAAFLLSTNMHLLSIKNMKGDKPLIICETRAMRNLDSGMSLQRELNQAEQIIQTSENCQTILFVPNQFQHIIKDKQINDFQFKKKLIKKIIGSIQDGKSNKAFDSLVLDKNPNLVYYFIDFTVSKNEGSLQSKFNKFVKHLMTLKEFVNFKQENAQTIQKYKDKIVFVIFGFSIKVQAIKPNMPEGSTEKDFVEMLNISFLISNCSKQRIRMIQNAPIESNNNKQKLLNEIVSSMIVELEQ